MLCSLFGIDVGRYRGQRSCTYGVRISMPVVSVSVVEFTDRGPLLKILADRSHLRPELQSRLGT